MKKFSLLICITFLCVIQLNAQKKSDFEGVVKYSLSFEDSGLPPEALAMFKNAEVVVYITLDYQRTDMDMVLQSTTTIVNMKKNTMFTLMDIGNKKYLIKMNEADIKKEKDASSETVIKYLDETKDIQGYKAQKAEVTIPEVPGMTMIVYFTEEIPVNTISPVYKGLKGFPLEYTMNMGGLQIKFNAKTITKEKVPDGIFDTPKEGYTEITAEALQAELMKQLGGQ